MNNKSFKSLLQFFKVLGNDSRLKILGLLANEERSVGELAELIQVKEPTISHHLAMMKEMGLVKSRAEGNVRIYWLDTQFLESMNRDILSQQSLSAMVNEEVNVSYDEKVLRAFMDGDQITQIPVKFKKRLVLLNWLVDKFEFGVAYPEARVNEIIQRHHHDYAAFRRYMVENKLMTRENSIYTRVKQD